VVLSSTNIHLLQTSSGQKSLESTPILHSSTVQYTTFGPLEADKLQWQHDKDQLISAQKLLEEATKAKSFGIYQIEPILIEPEPGFVALVWSLLEMLQNWGGRIREIAMDSACSVISAIAFQLSCLIIFI
jgi:hypothetical protein